MRTVTDQNTDLIAALRRIAALGPPEEPTEDYETGLWQAAEIARAALAEIHGAEEPVT